MCVKISKIQTISFGQQRNRDVNNFTYLGAVSDTSDTATAERTNRIPVLQSKKNIDIKPIRTLRTPNWKFIKINVISVLLYGEECWQISERVNNESTEHKGKFKTESP